MITTPKLLVGLASATALMAGTATAQDTKKSEVDPTQVESAFELLPETLLNAEGEEVTRESLEGKLIGFYFTASW